MSGALARPHVVITLLQGFGNVQKLANTGYLLLSLVVIRGATGLVARARVRCSIETLI